MKYLFDGKGFYPFEMKERYEAAGTWPEFGVEVNEEVRNQFILSPPPAGKILGRSEDGLPDWIDTPPPSLEERQKQARNQRDSIMNATSWLVERHRDEISTQSPATLKSEQFDDLQAYRQQLRDWPAQPGWPDLDMPTAPDWLAELKK